MAARGPGESSAFRVRMEVASGAQKGTVFDLLDLPFRIGRDRSCEVALADPDALLSGIHAEVEQRGGHVVIVDRSLNGTELRRGRAGTRVRVPASGETTLEDDDLVVVTPAIQLRVRLTALRPEAPASTTAVRRDEAPARTAAPGPPPEAADAPRKSRVGLLAGIGAFWVLLIAAVAAASARGGSPAATEGAKLVDALVRNDRSVASVDALARGIGESGFGAIHDLAAQARLSEARGQAQLAARAWVRIDLELRTRAAADPALLKNAGVAALVREAERRIGRLRK